ncbi:MAG TPA: cupin domain-containing protein [Nevskiaceae bacterium]
MTRHRWKECPAPEIEAMLVNADFSRTVVVTPDAYRWVTSPQRGVERMMLDRIGDEEARATSIVRYAAQSGFPRHAHPLGEEILVLSGTFSDESGDYPAGWYLRNPPGSSHRPSSHAGTVIFVKLRQMRSADDRVVRIATLPWQHASGPAVLPLFTSATEQVVLQRLAAGESVAEANTRSAELLVLAGELLIETRPCPSGSWIRLPPGDRPTLLAGAQGATFYLKTTRGFAPEWGA